uniref:Putative secreted protein n=1 Tax=Ixodes ricinus TaxID=34613 RepID=A0A6B0U4Z2_IXORI
MSSGGLSGWLPAVCSASTSWSGSYGTSWLLAISTRYCSTRILGGACTLNLCISLELTVDRPLSRAADAYGLPYLSAS